MGNQVGPLLQPPNHLCSTDLQQTHKQKTNLYQNQNISNQTPKEHLQEKPKKKTQTELRAELCVGVVAMAVMVVVLQIELPLGSGEARGPEIRVHGERLEREEHNGLERKMKEEEEYRQEERRMA